MTTELPYGGDPGPWMRVKDAAPYVGCHWKTLQKKCASGEFTARQDREGSPYLISPRMIAAHNTKTTRRAA